MILLRKLFSTYIINGILVQWLQRMEEELDVISKRQANADPNARHAQKIRTAQHNEKNFRLQGEPSGNFFGPGLA